jgi:hypothetical protein
MAIRYGKLNGYLKPLTKNMKIFAWKEPGEKRTVGRFFTELLAEAGSEVLENQKRDQIATRVLLTGTIDTRFGLRSLVCYAMPMYRLLRKNSITISRSRVPLSRLATT